MNLNDLLFESSVIEPAPDGYRNEEEDQSSIKMSDVRKTRLTLAHLNKLRVVNDIRKLERERKIDTLSNQYKPPSQDSGGL